MQIGCVTWFRLQYPELVLAAIGNGGRRDAVTGRIMKAEGVLAGMPDLILFCPNADFHALCIEMKTDKGRQSESQRLIETKMNKYGYKYVVVRSLEEFRTVVNEYLEGVVDVKC